MGEFRLTWLGTFITWKYAAMAQSQSLIPRHLSSLLFSSFLTKIYPSNWSSPPQKRIATACRSLRSSKPKVQGYNYPEFPLNVKEQKYGRLGGGLVFDQEIARTKRDQATRAPLGSTKALAMASRKAEA